VRRGIAIALLVVAGTVAAGFGLWHAGRFVWRRGFLENDFFAVRHVIVTGNDTIPAPFVRECARARTGDNLFAVRPDEMRAALEKVSAVAWARVARQFPDTLLIEIGERTAVARLGSALAVDATGHVLGPKSVRPALPLLLGLRDVAMLPGAVVKDPAFPDVMRILELCARPAMRPEVRLEAVTVEEDGLFTLSLEGPVAVRLSSADMTNKLDRLPVMLRVAAAKGLSFPEYDLTMAANYVGRVPEQPQESPAHAK
jgi:cell division septal protein FtsQ